MVFKKDWILSILNIVGFVYNLLKWLKVVGNPATRKKTQAGLRLTKILRRIAEIDTDAKKSQVKQKVEPVKDNAGFGTKEGKGDEKQAYLCSYKSDPAAGQLIGIFIYLLSLVDKSFKAGVRCLREIYFCRHGFRATARKVYEEETSKIKQNILVSNVLTLKLYLFWLMTSQVHEQRYLTEFVQEKTTQIIVLAVSLSCRKDTWLTKATKLLGDEFNDLIYRLQTELVGKSDAKATLMGNLKWMAEIGNMRFNHVAFVYPSSLDRLEPSLNQGQSGDLKQPGGARQSDQQGAASEASVESGQQPLANSASSQEAQQGEGAASDIEQEVWAITTSPVDEFDDDLFWPVENNQEDDPDFREELLGEDGPINLATEGEDGNLTGLGITLRRSNL